MKPPILLHELTLAACPDSLPEVRSAARDAGKEAGFNQETVESLALALNEAAMNVIQHGYHFATGKQMRLEVWLDETALTFDLIDQAPPVQVDTVQSRSLDEIRPGGLGVHFIRSLMDKMEFVDPPPGFGNRLRMVKFRRASRHGT